MCQGLNQFFSFFASFCVRQISHQQHSVWLAHARLKYDDVSLKGLSASHRVCQGCDLYVLEDIHHLVIQCPGFYDIRIQMYEDIFSLNGDIPRRFSMRGCFPSF